MNTLLNIANDGFDTSKQDDISSSIVYGTSGDLKDKIYLAVDLNADDNFTVDDFVIEITGANINSFTTEVFL